MDLYSARIRLAGEIKNEVNKVNLTASEIRLLQHIHGNTENAADPVVDIVKTGVTNRSDNAERRRLAEVYSGFHGEPGTKLVNLILGVPGVPLPQVYVAPEAFEPEEDPLSIDGDEPEVITPVEAEPIERTVVQPRPRHRQSLAKKAADDAAEAFAA